MSQTYNDRTAARRERDEEVLYSEEDEQRWKNEIRVLRARRRRSARTVNLIGWTLTLIAVVCAIGAFGLIIRNELARPAPIVIATAPAAQRLAPVVVQAQPATINPDAPAEAQPTARPVAAQPALAAPAAVQVAPQFSPVDLGDVPVPTVQTTLLSSEQYEAAQASEEQTYLNNINNANAGLTPAQRAVAEYNACVAAGGCGVVK